MVGYFRKGISAVFLVLALMAILVVEASAQQGDYRINIHRTFGYSAGSQIRGTFSIDIVGPANIKSVTYMIDGEVMAKVTDAPYNLSFQTTQYGVGWHNLNAVIETQDGGIIATPARRFEFVSAEQETAFIIPLVGGILLVVVLGIGLQMLVLRNKPKVSLDLGAPRNYGMRGGGVCPHCHRPFPLHWWALNAGLRTKFDRCDFCGKWSLIRRLSSSELAAAEEAELQSASREQAFPGRTEQDHLREMIDNSRYTDQ